MLKKIALAFGFLLASFAARADTVIVPQSSLSPSPGLYTTDFGSPFGRSDDSSFFVDLGFDFSFFGTSYDSLFVNNNGNLTFGSPLSTYIPDGLVGAYLPIISVFFSDIDTRPFESGFVYFDTSTPGQLVVTWDRVGRYRYAGDLLNTFQVVLRADDFAVPTGEGVIGFFYGAMEWEVTDTSTTAAVGFGDGLGNAVALDGSNQPGLNTVLDGKQIWFDRSLVAVPGPVAGAGLPILVVAGAALGWRSRRRRAAPSAAA